MSLIKIVRVYLHSHIAAAQSKNVWDSILSCSNKVMEFNDDNNTEAYTYSIFDWDHSQGIGSCKKANYSIRNACVQ